MRLTVDADLVRRLVAEQFPQWAHLPVRPVERDGWDNRTFRLGPAMSVRLPSSESYAAQVAKEQRWLPVLAPQVPLPIPVPLAEGVAAQGYPLPWSVYAWIDGAPVDTAGITDWVGFAEDLAGFLNALMRADPAGGPAPGAHNFHRGGALSTYDEETRRALAELRADLPARTLAAAEAVWADALAAPWAGPPVWVHGDVASGNLLARDRRLSAVIDFGCSAVGDPACDTTIAWTLLTGPGRAAFRTRLEVDAGVWARGRGWTLWKALITVAGSRESSPQLAAAARRVVDEVLADPVGAGRTDG